MMARPVWTGTLSFGLVSVPVQLYGATRGHSLRFHQLQRGTSDRIRNRRVNECTGEEVPADDIVKGLDVGEEYVVVEPEELDDIAPGRSRSLEISGFVDLDEIEPVYFDRTYYLGPKGEENEKVYGLLRDALAQSHRAGIATFVLRGREHLVAVTAEEDILALHTLHWADEVRSPREEVGPVPERVRGGPSKNKELRTAVQLVEAMSTAWDPREYHDTYQESVRSLVEAKSRGESVPKAAEPAESTNVIDLMDALRASVDSARQGPGRGGSGRRGSGRSGRSGGGAEGGKQSGGKQGGGKAKSRTAGGSSGRGLDGLSKEELYERATEAGVRGRSSMNRGQLIEALGGTGSKSA
ncbi:secreted protein [Streptomyces albus]|uniref:Non-homologous end joining protein Ku n=2 Tax=Streptomyces TaxID=1883 RepID=A0A0B5F637_STRA4|nr:secreted protein [Streptomyces albus]AOU81369.1 secreted protein [Streptomyces albus]